MSYKLLKSQFAFLCVVGFSAGSSTTCNPCPTGIVSTATIHSPGYGNSGGYQVNAPFACNYILTASTGRKVKVTLAPGAVIPKDQGDDLVVSKYTTGVIITFA